MNLCMGDSPSPYFGISIGLRGDFVCDDKKFALLPVDLVDADDPGELVVGELLSFLLRSSMYLS